MNSIQINNLGKRYADQWVFRNFSDTFSSNQKIAITGYNGSGKSTLLQIIAAFQSATEGGIIFHINGLVITPDNWYKYISCGAPYLDLHEDLTLRENIRFFCSFKPVQKSLTDEQFAEIAELKSALDKPLKHFSSGMRQRVRLSLAILADVPVLLLDEPLSNLDRNGMNWYINMIKVFAQQKLVVVCSNNHQEEISFCEKRIEIDKYK